MIELLPPQPEDIGNCSFFGLKADFSGPGAPAAILMQLNPLNQAVDGCEAQKMWLTPARLNHPAALKFYQSCGFSRTGFAVGNHG